MPRPVAPVLVALFCLNGSLSRLAAEPPVPPAGRLVKSADPDIWFEIYSERKPFETRLDKVHVVDFDDVKTGADVVPFDADRYAATHGVTITGTDGQYAGRAFRYARDYRPSSGPNMYAPGPKAGPGNSLGGHESTIQFVRGEKPAAVAGFGAVFIDADYPGLGPCKMTIHGTNGKELASVGNISGSSGSQLFRGVVAVNRDGQPISVIGRIVLINGNGWPESSSAEGVTLDDFVFSPPAAPGALVAMAPKANPSSAAPERPLPPSGTPSAPEVGRRPSTPPPGEMPAPAKPDPARPGSAPAPDAVSIILSGLKPGNVSGDTRAVIDAMLRSDVANGRTALARNSDSHAESLRLAAGLLDAAIIDPFSLIAYTYNFVESSAAFVPNGQADPVAKVLALLKPRAQNDPELRPYIADAIKVMCAIQLIHRFREDKPVGLSDHLLFSSLRYRPRPRDTRSSGEQKRFGPLPETDPLPPRAANALDMEELCSDPEARKMYLGKENAPRYWFLHRIVKGDKYFLCTGLWYNAMTFADQCDTSSRGRWDKVFATIAQAFAERGRFTSAVIIRILTSNNAPDFLADFGVGVDASDPARVTNLVIAFGYLLEATSGKWTAGLKGTTLGDLHTHLTKIAKPKEVEIARRCGGVDLKTFNKAP